MSVGWLHHYLLSNTAGLPKNIARKKKPFVRGEEHETFIQGTVTRFCACAAFWFLFWRTFFQDWLLVTKSSSTDPETSEKAIISVFKSYLVHILYFWASIVEKIRSHWGEVREAMFVVVCVPTNGSNVACNVVIWLSFLSIKFSSQRSTFSG